MLKISAPAEGGDFISFTRNPDYTMESMLSGNPRLVLDVDKLIKDWYKPLAFDEIGIRVNRHDKKQNFNKSNFDLFKSGRRSTKHGIKDFNEDEAPALEFEFEERILKDITNLGKYIISIDIIESEISKYKDVLSEYLEKHPDIIINSYKVKNQRKITDITTAITKLKESEPVN